MQHLLRLPPSLRCQILSHTSFLSRPLEPHQPTTRLLLKRTYARAKPPPKPSIRKPSSPATPDPPPPTSTHKPTSTGNPYADRLCHKYDTVLLYNSPSHTSLTIAALILAGCFFFSATSTAAATKIPSPSEANDSKKVREHADAMPWYIRIAYAGGAVMFAVFGTMMALAPSKIIRRIWLVREQVTSPALMAATRGGSRYLAKIETKSMLPFQQGRTIHTLLENVSIDRRINAPADLRWLSVPLSHSAAFTSYYTANPTAPPKSISGRLRSMNSTLLRAWPSLKSGTRKLLLRDGIAYVHIIGESGQWKLDLQGAEVLDSGRPIERLFREDAGMEKGVLPFLRRLAGEKEGM